MHRDKKLGLALALMVIGFGAALCFKQDLNSFTNSPMLKSSDELNEGIASRKSQPYIFESDRGRDDDDAGSHFKVTTSQTSSNTKSHGRDSDGRESDGRGDDSARFSNPFTKRLERGESDANTVILKKPEATTDDSVFSFDNNENGNSINTKTDTGIAVNNRKYHNPEHNSSWKSTTESRPFGDTSKSDMLAQNDQKTMEETTSVSSKKTLSEETHFTSFPELLGEKSSTTNTETTRANTHNFEQPTSTNSLTLQKPIVSLDDQIDPFAEEETSSATVQTKSAPQPELKSWGEQLQTPVATKSKSSPTLQKEISAETMLIHEVRRAETLSGLSARYLGSATKFMQIYEANRDVLKSPHDIRVGMKLRIPKRQRAGVQASKQLAPRASYQTAPAKHRVTRNRQQEEVNLLPQPKQEPRQINPNENLFTPVRRSPFNN